MSSVQKQVIPMHPIQGSAFQRRVLNYMKAFPEHYKALYIMLVDQEQPQWAYSYLLGVVHTCDDYNDSMLKKAAESAFALVSVEVMVLTKARSDSLKAQPMANCV